MEIIIQRIELNAVGIGVDVDVDVDVGGLE